MPRIALGLEYDGRKFAGWQLQRHATGVQTVVEDALSKVADMPVSTTVAGRTDAGVHAAMQVLHFESTHLRQERSWVLGANTHLPEAVAILWARVVDEAFHARYSATTRSYRYIILNRTARTALEAGRVCWLRHALDVNRMHVAAQYLVGEHDFASLRAAECQAHTSVRHIHSITVSRTGDYITIDVTANAFLQHMVRNIAGVLIAIGRNQRPVDWPCSVLEAKDRRCAGVTAPAAGLYLVGVHYADYPQLPSRAAPSSWPMFFTNEVSE